MSLVSDCNYYEIKRTYKTPKSACEGLAEEILAPTLMADVVNVEVKGKNVTVTIMCFCPEQRLDEMQELPSFKKVIQLFKAKFKRFFPKHLMEIEYESDPRGSDVRYSIVLQHNGEAKKSQSDRKQAKNDLDKNLGSAYDELLSKALERMNQAGAAGLSKIKKTKQSKSKRS